MSEVMKNSAIKLFGRTISLPHNRKFSANDSSPPSSSSSPPELSSTTKHEAERIDSIEEPSKKEPITSAKDEDASNQTTEDSKSPTSSTNFENPKTPSSERETSTSLLKSSKNGEQSESQQDKEAPKKPDKILPCPRCNSMDTKFCYYNNYNVNQPRHFCKNCQRYWTAGGTMRNVPVGAGRRKNKSISSSSCSSSAASHYRQMMMMMAPETLQAANGEAVLTFGSHDSPLSNSMASVLSLAEKTERNVLFHAPKQNMKQNKFDSCGREGNGGGHHSSIGTHEESTAKSYQGFPPQFPFQGSSIPWPYPWNPAMPPPQAFYPVPFYHPAAPPAYWAHPPISPQSSVNSPILGKHSREGEILFPPNSEKEKSSSESNNGVLIPKTLRIDDLNEAAKSSIWSTLGIKHDEKGNSLNGSGGLFKGFESRGGEKKKHVVEASPLLQANPAAMSRSLIFHERT